MAAGILIKRNGILIDNLRDSCVPLILNFIGGAVYDDPHKEITIPVQDNASIVSNPPVGSQRVVNIYVKDGKLVFDYEV